MRTLALALLLFPALGHARDLAVSANVTITGRWLEGRQVASRRERAVLSGAGMALGGSLDLFGRLGPLRLGGQLAADVLEYPQGSLEVARSAPLMPSAPTRDSVSGALFVTAAPFAGLAFGNEPFLGFLDLMLSLEFLSAKIKGEQLFSLTPVPTLRLGCALVVRGFGMELSVVGSFVGSPRLGMAVGIRF